MKNRLLAFFGVLVSLLGGVELMAQQYGRYTLVATQNTTARIVDTAGTVYKTWTLTGSTGYSAYMLRGGELLRTVTTTNSVFSGGGMHGRVQKLNWAGTILWDFTYSTTTYCAHHDICPMPNGNVLMIVYELKSAAEATAAGCSTSKILWPDKIVEIQPTGATTGTVVWEWKAWDHLIQNVNPSLPNYGVVNQHPELLNINYNNTGTTKDWMHMNGIDYNAELDQIVFSCHNLNEFFVIDHSTTTAQAASHSGGRYGKGGDFLYRWGNPASWGATGTTNFNVLHDVHWIPAGSPRAGSLVAFNNGASTTQSGADFIYPPYTSSGAYAFTSYYPATYEKRLLFNGKTTNMGSSEQLPNGNTLYVIALSGNVYEMDSNGTSLWSFSAGATTPQVKRYTNCYINGPTEISGSISDTLICQGKSITLTASASGIASPTYSWSSIPSGFTSSLQNPVVTPSQTTTYTVTASLNGCTTTKSYTVTVKPKPITSAISGVISTLPGIARTYSVTNTAGSTYSWIVSGGSIQSGAGTNSILVNWTNYNTIGNIKLLELASNGCYGDTVFLNAIQVLPVSWAGFDVQRKADGDGVEVKWSTASESNSDYFEVQRSLNWESPQTLIKLPAAGFSNSLLHYYWLDNEAPHGLLIYRIAQADRDGTMSYSPWKTVEGEVTDKELKLVPNPATNFTCLEGFEEGSTWVLYSLDGSNLAHGTQACLDLQGLSKGLYQLSIQGLNRVESLKLLIGN